jgi:hypothetical protein
MDTDSGGEWLTISATARHLGVSRRAIQKRIERNTIRWRPDGNKGRLVFVAPGDGRGDDHSEAHGDSSGDPRQRIAAAEREVELLRERIADLQEQHRERLGELREELATSRADRERLLALLETQARALADLREHRGLVGVVRRWLFGDRGASQAVLGGVRAD